MPNSLVFRLSVLVALIIGVAFTLLVSILFRSTSVAYVRTTEIVGHDAAAEDLRQRLLRKARAVALEQGRVGLQRLASEPAQFDLPIDVAFLIVGPDHAVIASTEALLAQAIVRPEPPASLSITVDGSHPGAQAELQLTTPMGAELLDRNGAALGQLVLLPGSLGENPGDAFALDVWRSAALALLAVVAVSILLTALVLRWFLRPIDRLTLAADSLVKGRQPAAMERSGHREIDRLIAAFNAAASSIAQTETMRRNLISDIAHELRTPVTNLKAQIEACAAGLIVADSDLLATLGNEVDLLAALVEDFQQLALSDAGQLRLTLEPLPLRATIEAIVLPMAQRVGAHVRIEIDPKLQVLADAHRLRQAIANLVDNARRHRGDGLVLTIDGETDGDRVKFRFADNGPGIAAVDRPHVFERFYRADKSRNRASGGAGLGLAIAKAIVEAMQGQIRLLPEHCGGAVFEIELPRST